MDERVLGYILHESPGRHREIEGPSPSVGTALFTLEIMEDKELLLSF